MTTPHAASGNFAADASHVGVQAGTVHGDVWVYQVPEDASPEQKYRIGVNYLDGGMPMKACELINEAIARGYLHRSGLVSLAARHAERPHPTADTWTRISPDCVVPGSEPRRIPEMPGQTACGSFSSCSTRSKVSKMTSGSSSRSWMSLTEPNAIKFCATSNFYLRDHSRIRCGPAELWTG